MWINLLNALAQHRYNVLLNIFWKFDDFTTILRHLDLYSHKSALLKTTLRMNTSATFRAAHSVENVPFHGLVCLSSILSTYNSSH